MPQGVVFLGRNGCLYNGNRTFYSMFNLQHTVLDINDFLKTINFSDNENKSEFLEFIKDIDCNGYFEMNITSSVIKISKKPIKKDRLMLVFTDIKDVVRYRGQLLKQREELLLTNRKLDKLAENTREIAITKTKTQIAQNMHDILGHSLTVVIGTTELAASESDMHEAQKKISRVGELLSSSLKDLRNTFAGSETIWAQTSLTKAIEHLKNDNIDIDFVVYGNLYELNSDKTEAVFRMCQEAVTNSIRHGKAKNIHILLRYKPEEVEVFAIDDGQGCNEINKSYGLVGIETRIKEVSGDVSFGSDGESGFTIRARVSRDNAL
jgi:signal transduction histidine kinase